VTFSAGAVGSQKTIRPTICSIRRRSRRGDRAATLRLFAGAKEVQTHRRLHEALGLDRFDRLIDWGWFYYITKPMFKAIDYFFRWTGNFGSRS
jgi:YidC/Oxa1 family membrane protein insertase